MGYFCHLKRRKSWRSVNSNESAFHQSFSVADSYLTPASNIAKLDHPVRETSHTVDMVTSLANQSLLSGNDYYEAGYIYICEREDVNTYEGRTAKFVV